MYWTSMRSHLLPLAPLRQKASLCDGGMTAWKRRSVGFYRPLVSRPVPLQQQQQQEQDTSHKYTIQNWTWFKQSLTVAASPNRVPGSFTFGELQIQLGQLVSDLFRQSRQIDAAVGHGCCEQHGSPAEGLRRLGRDDSTVQSGKVAEEYKKYKQK